VSDVIAATFIAIAATAYLRHLFELRGISLRDAAGGHPSRPPANVDQPDLAKPRAVD